MVSHVILMCPYCQFRALYSIQVYAHAREQHTPREWMHVARMTDAELGSFFLVEEGAL